MVSVKDLSEKFICKGDFKENVESSSQKERKKERKRERERERERII